MNESNTAPVATASITDAAPEAPKVTRRELFAAYASVLGAVNAHRQMFVDNGIFTDVQFAEFDRVLTIGAPTEREIAVRVAKVRPLIEVTGKGFTLVSDFTEGGQGTVLTQTKGGKLVARLSGQTESAAYRNLTDVPENDDGTPSGAPTLLERVSAAGSFNEAYKIFQTSKKTAKLQLTLPD
jgi:hypothetical protein